MTRRAKGIGLLSGGLDSALACLVLRDAGADVECLHFFTGFCVTAHNSRVGRTDRPIANHALKVAAEMGVPMQLVDISETYLPMVLRPAHGYGKFMNPCVDCRIFMLRRAKDHMDRVGADFVFTGEVLGQRPRSQKRSALEAIEAEAGLEGRLLRPLSARLMPPTGVEASGLLDREKLHGIHGRGRKKQIELARHYGITDFMQPAGGCCMLTDKAYSRKLREIIEHEPGRSITPEQVFILGVGRHFRVAQGLKLIVGRDETENKFLEYYAKSHWCVRVNGFAGPTAIMTGEVNGHGDETWQTMASLVARYSDGRHEPVIEVRFIRGERIECVTTSPASSELLEKLRV
jgi:tRNA U34 2-thiouridine synthase MnmA/TrmU